MAIANMWKSPYLCIWYKLKVFPYSYSRPLFLL